MGVFNDRSKHDWIEHGRDAAAGGTYILRASLGVELPRARVFEFFADAHNLEAITPASLGFQILTPDPVVIRTGALIDYRIRLHGVPMRWRTLISRWEPPDLFTDEQLAGPYASWVHTHTFRDAPSGGTVVEDEVRYRLPFDPVSRIALPLVRRQLDGIFRHRTRRVRELLGVAGTDRRSDAAGGP